MKKPTTKRLLIGAEARRNFVASGMSIARWAKLHRVSAALVYEVLAGRTCRWGESHRIAVLLGMKDGVIVDGPRQEPDFAAYAAKLADSEREEA